MLLPKSNHKSRAKLWYHIREHYLTYWRLQLATIWWHAWTLQKYRARFVVMQGKAVTLRLSTKGETLCGNANSGTGHLPNSVYNVWTTKI